MMIQYSAVLKNGDKNYNQSDYTVFPPNVTQLTYAQISAEKQGAFDTLQTWAHSVIAQYPSVVPPEEERIVDIIDMVTVIKISGVIEYISIQCFDTSTTYTYTYSEVSQTAQDAATVYSS